MKKVFAFAAVAAMISLASCSGAAESLQKIADSIRKDSIMRDSADKANAAAAVADSTAKANAADSAAKANAADSAAKATEKKK